MTTMNLTQNWYIRSADEISAYGAEISSCTYPMQGWYPAQVPATVLATLVDNGVFADPYYGMNLKNIPPEIFRRPWWYRREFTLTDVQASATVLLHLDGINYRGDIWLNGRQIAAATELQGAFRQYQFDITSRVVCGRNVLAIEVSGPRPGDFSTGFVDWNPPPPDGNMGLFRPVRLRFCHSISLEAPFVYSRLEAPSFDMAELGVTVELVNHKDYPVSGYLQVQLETGQCCQPFSLGPRERKTVLFNAADFTVLRIRNPRLWWCNNLGKPDLYQLHLQAIVDGTVADERTVTFGIRSVEDYRTRDGHLGFKLNGKKILVKAAGWTDDLLLADTAQKLLDQVRYIRHLNLNAIRLEGIWGKDQTLYDLCDRYGILMMVGWSCHWEHEEYLGKPVDERFGGIIAPEEIALLSQSWQDQVLWLRNHPAVFAWTLASDKVPTPQLEQKYRDILQRYDPTRPCLASTGGVGSEQGIIGSEEVVSEISGPTGVKMLGPYAYTPPIYWFTDTRRGGAYGFNTETCPGATVPPLESLEKMLPAEHLWPIDEYWHFHCGLNEFGTLQRYRQAMDRRYGRPQSLEEFALKAQVLNYELMRPMFEAFQANKGKATGIVQWMLNAAWPKMYWQLYDWYLRPTGAFYAARKACQPLHLLYHYGNHGIYIVNDYLTAFSGCQARIRVVDIAGLEVCHELIRFDTAAESARCIYELGEFPGISRTWFLSLELYDKDNREIGNNFYWLSTQPDILDYRAKVEPWSYYTPSSGYADFTLLNSLPPVSIDAEPVWENTPKANKLQVRLNNRDRHLAFFCELLLRDQASGEVILPIYWQDNYISLLPGQTRTLEATFNPDIRNPQLELRGWNIRRLSYPL